MVRMTYVVSVLIGIAAATIVQMGSGLEITHCMSGWVAGWGRRRRPFPMACKIHVFLGYVLPRMRLDSLTREE